MDHQHSEACTPDNCFRAKMRYRREHGGLAVHAPSLGNGKTWFDSTIKTEQDRTVAAARANGWEARLKNPVYDK